MTFPPPGKAPQGCTPIAALRSVIVGWAIGGGVVLVAVVLVNVMNVFGTILWRSFPGDYELTEMGVAIAVFAFLPYCQLTAANVTAEIFTARTGPQTRALLGVAGALIALCFAGLLLWAMTGGMISRMTLRYTTAILQIPVWYAYVPILVSWVLLILAALVTLGEQIRRLVGPTH